MNARSLASIAFAALAALACTLARAQTPVSENFTGVSTTNQWLPYNGACLTAGNNTGSVPACAGLAYYLGQTLVGGVSGTLPDPSGQGALRFTNGYTSGDPAGDCTTSTQYPSGKDFAYGFCQNGAIVSDWTFPTNQGIQIQFETVTYRGDSGGTGKDGADGISFYLLDGCMPIQGGTVPSTCPQRTANTTYGATGTFSGIGSWGGSLAYTCSNGNAPYSGLVGAYLGLGIDEFGNFLNGTSNSLEETGSSNTGGDNTATGGLYQPGRIGLRGAGSVSWQALNNAYGTSQGSSYPYYPSSLTASEQESAVQQTCETGNLYNYTNASNPVSVGAASLTNTANPAGILDYQAIPGGYEVLSQYLPTGIQLASESALTRTLCAANASSDNGCVMPIVYNLTITPAGLLSLSFSVNGGATQQIIKDQSITYYNGPLPSSFRFGFAGSTGGDTNIHEILCFQAQPSSLSEGSAGVNQQPSAKIESGTGAFAYFTYYNPDNWTGRVTANQLDAVTNTSTGVTTLEVTTTPTWDASCVLTGGTCASTLATDTAEAPSSRTILRWNGTQGVPLDYDDLSSAEQTAVDSGDPSGESEPGARVAYLRGDRTNELNSSDTCPAASLQTAQPCFRDRDDVLADIVDSSPTWVGPPSSPYTATWSDRLYPTTTMPENTGTQNYSQFVGAEETRENVVYVGANDGLLHGFRSGASNADGSFNSSAPNDGYEVLAYMPGATISGAEAQTGTGTSATYTSAVDTIHGTNPTNGNAVTANLDYSNPQYGHNFYVDATPGTGDLFYGGAWHTWLVGGMGAGGAVIYALDVTNPANFSEGNASTLVMGEWNPATIVCQNVPVTSTNPGCGPDLGNTYGTPQITRLHNGTWGIIFGNGFGSASGDAGIFILTVSPGATTNDIPTETMYYLSTGTAAAGITNNGIAYVTPVDLDGDNITDYVYAGDLNGNVWRFDLTSNNPQNWGIQRCLDASCTKEGTDYVMTPVFTTPSGQPITSQLVVASGQTAAGLQTIMIAFGTGQKLPFTNTGSTSFATGTQAIYGVWDWAMANWNSKSTTQYAALAPGNTGLSSSYTLTYANLEEQQFASSSGCSLATSSNCTRDITANATVCWQGTSACQGTNDQFGWYVNLPGTGCLSSSNCSSSSLPEQIVFNPELVGSALVVNSTIPPSNTLLSCTTASQTGYTYSLQILSGGAFNGFFPTYDENAAGIQTNASGTSFYAQTGNGESWLVYQTYQQSTSTSSGSGQGSQYSTSNTTQINVPSNSAGQRLTWTELR